MGRLLQVVGNVFVVAAIIMFALGMIGLADHDAEVRKIDATIIEDSLPHRVYTENPHLTITQKQQIANAVSGKKHELRMGAKTLRDSSFTGSVVVMLVFCLVGVAVGGTMVQVGKKWAAFEMAADQKLSGPLVELSDMETLPTRRGNPFKRGEVSETVLPRGEFHKKRNKFRRTIERPNSDGY